MALRAAKESQEEGGSRDVRRKHRGRKRRRIRLRIQHLRPAAAVIDLFDNTFDIATCLEACAAQGIAVDALAGPPQNALPCVTHDKQVATHGFMHGTIYNKCK